MFDCLILGDSIAVGTKMFAPKECVAYAHGGWNTWQWNKDYLGKGLNFNANTIVISLGTNDHKYVKTEVELRKMRTELHGNNVIWIMPPCNEGFCKPNVNEIVTKIAGEYHDMIIKTDKVQADHIHPSWSGYKELVKESGLRGSD
jgi:hypothetical protein